MYLQAFKNCLCGNQPLSQTFKDIFYFKPLGKFWKILIITLLSILGLSVIACLLYLLFVVSTNAFSQLFDDTICENSIWTTCGSYIQTTYGDSKASIQLLPGMFVSLFVILFISGIASMISSFNGLMPWLGSFFIMYVAWALLWIWISIFAGKALAINKIDGCDIYAKYGVIGTNLVPGFGQISLCQKIRNIGPNLGAIEDVSLPGTWSECNRCMNIGFWSIFISALFLPLICLSIHILIKRFKRKLNELRNEYDPLN